MKIRLNRISNLFREGFLRMLLITFSLLFVLPNLLLLLLGSFHWIYLVLILLLNLVAFLTLYFGFPGKAEFYEGVISYSEYYEISRGDRKRLSFTVTDVREVEFLQNSFEKARDIGRIRFRGTAEITPPLKNTEQKITHFCLCGIPNFAEFEKQLSTQYSKKAE